MENLSIMSYFPQISRVTDGTTEVCRAAAARLAEVPSSPLRPSSHSAAVRAMRRKAVGSAASASAARNRQSAPSPVPAPSLHQL